MTDLTITRTNQPTTVRIDSMAVNSWGIDPDGDLFVIMRYRDMPKKEGCTWALDVQNANPVYWNDDTPVVPVDAVTITFATKL